MSKKIILLIVLVFASIILAVSFTAFYGTTQNAEGNQPQSTPPENPEEPLLVVPENPVGTFGVISALATALGIFAIVKKRR